MTDEKLLISPIPGWRAFAFFDLKLYSLGSHDSRIPARNHKQHKNSRHWPDRTKTAGCSRREHSAPAKRCSCGLYSTKTLWELVDYLTIDVMRHYVIAQVTNSGRVIVGERGYRAEIQTVEALYISRYFTSFHLVLDLASHWQLRRIGRKWNVPVYRFNSITELAGVNGREALY